MGNGTIFLGSGGGAYGTTGITGNLNILGGSFNMDQTTGAVSVTGNIDVASGATLALSGTAGGDIAVGGNWTNSGTFSPNGRAVTFNGTGAQSITNASGETFNYLINNKASGTLTLASNITVNGSSGDVLQLINAGAFDLNGKSLTLSNNGGNILVTGAPRTISSTGAATINITGSKTVTSASSGSLIIASNVTTILTQGLDCGSGSLTTINGTLQINAGGFCSGNSPKYGASSLLKYNSNTTYNRQLEWTADIAAIGTIGLPTNVQISNNTTLNILTRVILDLKELQET